MIEIEARFISASSRGALTGLSGIGQPDVGDARVGEHFRLAEFRAADADRAALDLPAARPRGDLCVLACGRSRMPARGASACMRAMLFIARV